MSGTDSNTEQLKRCYALWHETKGGSVAEWLEICADQVEFLSLAMGRDPGITFTSPRSTKAEIGGYFDGLTSEWRMIHYTVDRFVTDGDMVCAIGSTAWTNKATGKTVDTPKVDVWRFSDGKAVSFFEYYDTLALAEAARA